MNTIEIQLSKTKLILTFLGSTLFVILAIILVKNPENFRGNESITRLVGILGICFFGLIMLTIPRKLFDKKPGLILDENGIIDNSSMKGFGTILWKDIISIRRIKVSRSTNLLLIFVSNPEKYFGNPNFFIQYLRKLGMKTYGTPISISSNALKCNFTELEGLISERLEKQETPNS
jgi:hypothetical protein